MAQPSIPFNWRPVIQRRLAAIAGIFVFWTLAVEVRLVYLQVVRHDELVARAEKQQLRTIESPAKRGEIYDRNGRVLAFSVDTDTVYAVPTEIDDPAKAARALCGVFDDCSKSDEQALLKRLSQKRPFAYVKRRVTPEEARKVAALGLEGIGFMPESRRFYPNKELAANVVGYVGLDNKGLHGIESAYDKVIRGKEGKVLVQADARRHAFSRVERTPTSGGSLELTIDEGLQYIVERELRDGVIDNRAKGGAAIVMDPHTGEILAMANYPTFNPNAYNGADPDLRRNRAVQDLYEPGSTFKIVTASAALEEKVWKATDMIDVSAGRYNFGSSSVPDMHRYGILSFTDVIVKSSNVGAIKIGLRVGAERMGLYVNRFGFGRPASPDFPGESPGIVYNPAKLNERALGSVSMGYQVGVTPLQMVTAFSAVANGGNLLEPRIIRAVVRDGVRTKIEPKVVRRAIEPGTAAELTTIMEKVVIEGTAKAAKLDGYTVAGKTGTAEKLIDGRYSNWEHNTSFVGFVPSRAPQLSIIVLLDTPRAHGNTGGVTAAPIFNKIATASLRHMGVLPDVNPEPPVMVARRDERSDAMTPATASAQARGIVTLAANGDGAVVPDLRGMGARDVLRTLGRLGLSARIQGEGVVVDQTPAPGDPLETGSTCIVVLGRVPQTERTSGAHP